MVYKSSSKGILYFASIMILIIFIASADSGEGEEINDVIIGIDLGTTYSSVGIFKNGQQKTIPNEYGNKVTPSYVAFTESGETLIGEDALSQATINPKNTIYSVKRWIGHKFNDYEVREARRILPYSIVSNNTNPYIEVTFNGVNQYFAPEQISALILSKMKKIAEDYLGRQVTRAVITIPATFNSAQRQATKDACEIAGLKVLKLINEPTAAAIAYGYYGKGEKDKNILVFDLGGGTFDVSMLKVTSKGEFKVLASEGDANLGGDDFDKRIMDHLIDIFKKKFNENPMDNKFAIQKLKQAAEKAKRELSSADSTKIEIKKLYNGKDLIEVLTRVEFEELNKDLFEKTLTVVETLLDDVKMKKSEVDIVMLVGGSSRIPKVQDLIRDHFRIEPSVNVDPQEAVAQGAAIYAGILYNTEIETTKRIVVKDLTALGLGIEVAGGFMSNIIQKNTYIPTKQHDVYTTAVDNQTQIKVQIFQGNSINTANNTKLGEFELFNIPKRPQGIPKFNVTFIIDEHGILNVSAVDMDTGNNNSTKITTWRLSADEIVRMANEANEFSQKEYRAKAEMDSNSKRTEL